MKIPGKKVRRRRIVRTDKYVVILEVDAIIPDFDPSEACFEPETVKFLKEVEDRAKADDVDWLKERGQVYQALNA
ncbi:MAG: hypothetical protein NUW37_16200 [Planctomycetes bacterium]|nr:hypothetical protein [Planctomycetota bacterium]